MWTAWLLLMLNGLFFTLRLAGNTGSFPRALTREEIACSNNPARESATMAATATPIFRLPAPVTASIRCLEARLEARLISVPSRVNTATMIIDARYFFTRDHSQRYSRFSCRGSSIFSCF